VSELFAALGYELTAGFFFSFLSDFVGDGCGWAFGLKGELWGVVLLGGGGGFRVST